MTEKQKSEILRLKGKGLSITQISNALELPIGTVKSYLSRHNTLSAMAPNVGCLYCGKPVTSLPGHRKKNYCDDSCYRKHWRTTHKQSRKEYTKTCQCCGIVFIAKSKKAQKFCSRSCYLQSRKKEH